MNPSKKMAESGGSGEGPDDKEAKRRKLPDPKQGEEEKAISPKGNEEVEQKQEEEKTGEGSSSSAQGFDFAQLIEKLFAGEKNQKKSLEEVYTTTQDFFSGRENTAPPVLPLKKREIQFLQGDDPHNLVFTLEEESGDSEDSASPDASGPVGMLLFETQLKPSNRLAIPAAKASKHFPAQNLLFSGETITLQITDIRKKEWEMPIIYYAAEAAFLFVKGWTEFASWHKLDSGDVIGFYRPMPRLDVNHFLVKFERTAQILTEKTDFRRENFLFQVELSSGDIGYRRLFMPSREVEIHFPAIKHIEGQRRTKDILRFTDDKSKDWYMEVVCYNANSYMIIQEWYEFVKDHKLEEKDVIKFYKPVEPLHLKHFLIEIVRKEVGTNPSRTGGGEPSEPSGSGSYKGKEKIAAG